jgi:hypothetical protein
MTRRHFACGPIVPTALAAIMLILVGTPVAAQDATGVGAISGVVVNALTRVNAERAPDYRRVDICVDRTFTVGGQPLNLFLACRT